MIDSGEFRRSAAAPDKSHEDYRAQKHSVMSDLDVLAYRPGDPVPETRVMAVSCKAWQEGLSPTTFLNIFEGRTKESSAMSMRTFKELLDPLWAAAFRAKILELTRQVEFTYVIAVTRLPKGCDAGESASRWMEVPAIRDQLQGATIRFLTLTQMWNTIVERTTTTLAPSDLGRLAQLLKAAGVLAEKAPEESAQTRIAGALAG